jgi:peptidoglycan/LPS O-acetylase OafA/YrhL
MVTREAEEAEFVHRADLGRTKFRKFLRQTLVDSRVGRVRELDGWRAISVLLVIAHHIGAYQHPRLLSHFSVPAHIFQYCGDLGVKVFFVISGFVICRLLISQELLNGSVSLKAFYYRRVFRILPPFYFYLWIVSLLLYLGIIHESWRAICGSALFLFDIRYVTPHSWFVGHTWSLALEEQFYILFPAMWVFTPGRWRVYVFVGLFLLIAAWDLFTDYNGGTGLTSAHTREGFACICCGVLMATLESHLRRLANRVFAFIVALLAFMLLAHPMGSESTLSSLYECLLVPPAIGIVLLFSMNRGRWLRATLCSKPMQALGITSYGIYLWQQLFTAPKEYITRTGPQPYFSEHGQIIMLLLPLLSLIVPLSYFLIEKPAMRVGTLLSTNQKRLIRKERLSI